MVRVTRKDRMGLVLASVLVVACGDDGTSNDDGSASAASTSGADEDSTTDTDFPATECEGLEGVDMYAVDLEKMGDEGVIKARLLDADPAPPDLGLNVWRIMLMDAEMEAPLDEAELETGLWMPDHNHGGAAEPQAVAMGGGEFEVSNILFHMAGVWEIRFDIAGTMSDSVLFRFCIENK